VQVGIGGGLRVGQSQSVGWDPFWQLSAVANRMDSGASLQELGSAPLCKQA
jgi:hypothetical protein